MCTKTAKNGRSVLNVHSLLNDHTVHSVHSVHSVLNVLNVRTVLNVRSDLMRLHCPVCSGTLVFSPFGAQIHITQRYRRIPARVAYAPRLTMEDDGNTIVHHSIKSVFEQLAFRRKETRLELVFRFRS